jgi:hypothetical protein
LVSPEVRSCAATASFPNPRSLGFSSRAAAPSISFRLCVLSLPDSARPSACSWFLSRVTPPPPHERLSSCVAIFRPPSRAERRYFRCRVPLALGFVLLPCLGSREVGFRAAAFWTGPSRSVSSVCVPSLRISRRSYLSSRAPPPLFVSDRARPQARRWPVFLRNPAAPLLRLDLPESAPLFPSANRFRAPPVAARFSSGPVLRLETDAARFSAQPREACAVLGSVRLCVAGRAQSFRSLSFSPPAGAPSEARFSSVLTRRVEVCVQSSIFPSFLRATRSRAMSLWTSGSIFLC